MTKRPMRVVSGSVLSVSQKSIVTKGVDANGSTVTYSSEGIALQLDSLETPLTVNTTKASEIFIAMGDRLEVACLEFPGCLEIYGIRNHTDGSVYLARPVQVASARWEIASIPICLAMSAILTGIGYVLGEERKALLIFGLSIGIALPASICMIGVMARLFGRVAMPEARGHAQPGGRREMNAARDALAIAEQERHRMRVV